MPDYLAPEWAHAALLTIDLQRDFLDDGPGAIPGTAAVVPAVTALADAFRRAGLPVVHLLRFYRPDGTDVDLVRRAAIENGLGVVTPGSPGSQLAAGLVPGNPTLAADELLGGAAQPLGPREWAIFKPRWGGFHRTGLDDLLRAGGVSTVVVAGCNLPNCPRATLFEASERDYRAVLAEDAVSQASQERLRDLAAIGVQLLSSAEVIAEVLTPVRAAAGRSR